MEFVSVFNSLFDCVNKLILKKAILQMNHGKIYFNTNKNILSICLKCFVYIHHILGYLHEAKWQVYKISDIQSRKF